MKETRKEGMDKERTEEREVQRREKNTAGKEEETSAASLGCRWSCSSVRSQRESWWADGSTHSPSLPQEINSPLDLLAVFGPLKQMFDGSSRRLEGHKMLKLWRLKLWVS
ncbi:hypothetical protein ACQJBY_057632 [Aegilops geniculata]